MHAHVPNALTGGRLVLAVVFFALLSIYQHNGRGDPWLLSIAFMVYLVALVTDWLDGYLARKWKVEGAFGRVVDPLVDKVLVIGTFIFLAGKNFVVPGQPVVAGSADFVMDTISGITPWMVVLILFRELLVTSLRGMAESAGQAFGAAWSGKLKMVTQSVTVLIILVYLTARPTLLDHGWEPAARIFRDICIYITVAVTLISGVVYLRKSVAIYAAKSAGMPAA